MKCEALWSQPEKQKRDEDKQEVKWAGTNNFLCGLEEAIETSPLKKEKKNFLWPSKNEGGWVSFDLDVHFSLIEFQIEFQNEFLGNSFFMLPDSCPV